MIPGITPARQRDISLTISQVGHQLGQVSYNVRRCAFGNSESERKAEYLRWSLANADEAVRLATQIREYLRAESERVTREESR
jgi:hypothetical protein